MIGIKKSIEECSEQLQVCKPRKRMGWRLEHLVLLGQAKRRILFRK
mgnify:CR=1 FL=1